MKSCSIRSRSQNDKIDRMQKDFDYRLCTLSAQQLGAGDQMNCAAAGTRVGRHAADAQPPMQPRRPRCRRCGTIDATGQRPAGHQRVRRRAAGPVRGRPPGTLGTLSRLGAAATASLAAIPTSTRRRWRCCRMRNMTRPAPPSAALPTPIRRTRSGAAGDLLGRQYRLHPEGLCQRGAHLCRSDQEISQVTARARQHAEARPVVHRHGPEIRRLHHPWPLKTKYPQAASQTPRPSRRARRLRKGTCGCVSKARSSSVHGASAGDRDGAAPRAWPGAVAVSGGGDSLALMHLLARRERPSAGRADRRSRLARSSAADAKQRGALGQTGRLEGAGAGLARRQDRSPASRRRRARRAIA